MRGAVWVAAWETELDIRPGSRGTLGTSLALPVSCLCASPSAHRTPGRLVGSGSTCSSTSARAALLDGGGDWPPRLATQRQDGGRKVSTSASNAAASTTAGTCGSPEA